MHALLSRCASTGCAGASASCSSSSPCTLRAATAPVTARLQCELTLVQCSGTYQEFPAFTPDFLFPRPQRYCHAPLTHQAPRSIRGGILKASPSSCSCRVLHCCRFACCRRWRLHSDALKPVSRARRGQNGLRPLIQDLLHLCFDRICYIGVCEHWWLAELLRIPLVRTCSRGIQPRTANLRPACPDSSTFQGSLQQNGVSHCRTRWELLKRQQHMQRLRVSTSGNVGASSWTTAGFTSGVSGSEASFRCSAFPCFCRRPVWEGTAPLASPRVARFCLP